GRRRRRGVPDRLGLREEGRRVGDGKFGETPRRRHERFQRDGFAARTLAGIGPGRWRRTDERALDRLPEAPALAHPEIVTAQGPGRLQSPPPPSGAVGRHGYPAP